MHRLQCENKNWREKNDKLHEQLKNAKQEKIKEIREKIFYRDEYNKIMLQNVKYDQTASRSLRQIDIINEEKFKEEQKVKEKEKEIIQLNEQLVEAKANQIKDEGIAYYKQKAIDIEKQKDKIINTKESELQALLRDYERNCDDNRKLNQIKTDVMDKHNQQGIEIEWKDDRITQIEQENNDLKNKLFVRDKECVDIKLQYEELVRTLKMMDYQGCSCQLRTIPAVVKAQEFVLQIKPDKEMISQVDRMRQQNKAYSKEVKEQKERIQVLEKLTEKLEKEETEKILKEQKEHFDTQQRLSSALEELELIKMSQNTILEMANTAKEYRDDQIENLKATIHNFQMNHFSEPQKKQMIQENVIENSIDKNAILMDATPSIKETVGNVEFKTPRAFMTTVRKSKRNKDQVPPDNVQSCDYYKQFGKKNYEQAFEAVIGSPEFDKIMQQRLSFVLQKMYPNQRIKRDRVFEVMAGTGRNFPVLNNFFSNIEMLEQNPDFAKYIDDQVHTYSQRIQNYNWPCGCYDTVLGVWCLCYLNYQDRQDFMKQAIFSIKDDGFIVLFEPVLNEVEKQKERPHSNINQQMIIRPHQTYVDLFSQWDMTIVYQERYEQADINNEEMMVYVIQNMLFCQSSLK